MKKKIEELKDEPMYCFVTADGELQLPTLAPSFEMCLAFMELLAKSKISQHPAELFGKGWEIVPVKITAVQNGSASDGFNRSLKKLSTLPFGLQNTQE